MRCSAGTASFDVNRFGAIYSGQMLAPAFGYGVGDSLANTFGDDFGDDLDNFSGDGFGYGEAHTRSLVCTPTGPHP